MDDQELPKKMRLIAQAKEEVKNETKLPKSPKQPKSDLLDSSKHMGYEMKLPGMSKPLKPIPIFQQKPGEKERQFFRRVNQQVSVSILICRS